MNRQIASIDEVQQILAAQGYVCGRPLATVVFLSLRLGRPLFLEGEAGVGKTEIAKAIAAALGRRLIRLQCYEGLDAASAVAEWNFAAQMIAIRTAEASGGADRDLLRTELFTDDYLIERPLLQAMRPQPGGAPVLLIDELDRTDEPFEAFLLEALSDFQVTIPELGTIRAAEPPIVILTSNRTREVHDALKRRCLYHWVDYPTAAREMEILRARVPEAQDTLSREIVAFVQRLRAEDLFKKPGVAETIDWAKCLLALDVIQLSPEVIADTLGAILKYQDDIQKIQGSEARKLLHATGEEPPLVVVEGYMDAIACQRAGVAAVAPLGTALTEDQMEVLWRLHPEPTLSFDGDGAGRRAASSAIDRALPLLKPGIATVAV
ncbi:MAG: AAA family ATPase, partial [Rhodobacterales bacterium]|nr:AAA family ATPase [Rhodobacterales bacterium]